RLHVPLGNEDRESVVRVRERRLTEGFDNALSRRGFFKTNFDPSRFVGIEIEEIVAGTMWQTWKIECNGVLKHARAERNRRGHLRGHTNSRPDLPSRQVHEAR